MPGRAAARYSPATDGEPGRRRRRGGHSAIADFLEDQGNDRSAVVHHRAVGRGDRLCARRMCDEHADVGVISERGPRPDERPQRDPRPAAPGGDRGRREGRPLRGGRVRSGRHAAPGRGDPGCRRGRPGGDPRPERFASPRHSGRPQLHDGASLGRRALLAEAMRRLREQARRTPPPQWVRVVGGFTEWQFAERRLPTLAELNEAAPDTPVFVLHLYDRALLNRAALLAVGYTKDTPEPPGGQIERDRAGNPTGLLIAKPNASILYSTLAKGPKLSREHQLVSTRYFMRELNRLLAHKRQDRRRHDPVRRTESPHPRGGPATLHRREQLVLERGRHEGSDRAGSARRPGGAVSRLLRDPRGRHQAARVRADDRRRRDHHGTPGPGCGHQRGHG